MRNKSDQQTREQGSLFATGSSRNELIKIQDHNGKKAVSARELYEKLGMNKAVWSRWYRKNITENQYAIENEDWVGFNMMLNGNETQDFALTIDFAKKICMLARTQAGEEIRQYFVECERQLMDATKPLSTLDLMEMSIKKLREQEKEIADVKLRMSVLEAKSVDQSESDYMSIKGFAHLIQMSVDHEHAKVLGMRASSICRSRHIDVKKIHDQRFGAINIYPISILEEVFRIRLA